MKYVVLAAVAAVTPPVAARRWAIAWLWRDRAARAQCSACVGAFRCAVVAQPSAMPTCRTKSISAIPSGTISDGDN